MIETDFPAAARALRANLGIGEEEKLTIPNIAISVEKLRQEIKQERERAERAERERDELLRTFAHTHVSIPPSKKLELDDDTCAKCGLDLRHPIHKPENVEKARSALEGKA